MALGLFRDDIDLADAFGRELARDLRHGEAAFRRLSAGHGDGVVEQELVGDGHVGRYRGANRQQSGMRVGAVAQIDEDMRR